MRSRLWRVVAGALVVIACGAGKPSLGAVRVSLVTRTNDTFVADATVTYTAGSSDDLLKEIVCIVFPEGALGPTARVSDAPTTLAGTGTFPVPPRSDGYADGTLTIALTGTGKAGRYEVLCGVVSSNGLTSEVDVRTGITVP
jgi:hypothetical protein